MKQLFLLRHAKAAGADNGMDDFDRPLAPRGRRSAPRIGAYMRHLKYKPDVVLCSPAVRTRQTWKMVRETLDCAPAEDFRPELYLGEPKMLFDTLRALDDGYGSAIVVGHNPAILTLALGLVGRRTTSANPFGKYPTAALTVFDFDADRWADIAPGQGLLVGFTRPKELDANA